MGEIEISTWAYKFFKGISDETGTSVSELLDRYARFLKKNPWMFEPPYMGKGGSYHLKDGYDPSKWTKKNGKIIKKFFEVELYR